MFYVVESGKPDGELYHRGVAIFTSKREAEDYYKYWLRVKECYPSNWFWGPSIERFEKMPKIIVRLAQ